MNQPPETDSNTPANGVAKTRLLTPSESLITPTPPGTRPEHWLALGGKRMADHWQIAERDAQGNVIGLAQRFDDGRKCYVSGGHRGLTLAWPLPSYAGSSADDPVFIVEGASDVAAGIGIGLTVIGRPSALGGKKLLGELVNGLHVCLIAENDKSGAGLKGAHSIGEYLAPLCVTTRVFEFPPAIKDLRAAVVAGMDHQSVKQVMRSSARAIEPVASTEAGQPVTLCMADVQPELVSWLWPNRIACGKVTIIGGDPGLGKSWVTVDIAARVSAGLPWPDSSDSPDVLREPGGVVLLNAEDGLADTVRPRLDAAGADVRQIRAITAVHAPKSGGKPGERGLDLGRDIPALEAAIVAMGNCKLIVIDPISAYVGSIDGNGNTEVRGLLAPLAALAERYGVAVVLVSHCNKAKGGPAIYRMMGSLAFVTAARSAWVVSKDKNDDKLRLMLSIKSNIAPETGGLSYRIGPVGIDGKPAIDWQPGMIAMSADEALGCEGSQGGGRSDIDDAKDWLLDFLSPGEQMAAEVIRESASAGISKRTLDRAKAALGVKARKGDFGGGWWCGLPKVADEACHSGGGGNLGMKQGATPSVSSKVASDYDAAFFDGSLGRVGP